jgi:hypothetical protein
MSESTGKAKDAVEQDGEKAQEGEVPATAPPAAAVIDEDGQTEAETSAVTEDTVGVEIGAVPDTTAEAIATRDEVDRELVADIPSEPASPPLDPIKEESDMDEVDDLSSNEEEGYGSNGGDGFVADGSTEDTGSADYDQLIDDVEEDLNAAVALEDAGLDPDDEEAKEAIEDWKAEVQEVHREDHDDDDVVTGM